MDHTSFVSPEVLQLPLAFSSSQDLLPCLLLFLQELLFWLQVDWGSVLGLLLEGEQSHLLLQLTLLFQSSFQTRLSQS